MLSIHVRPPKIDARRMSGHWEGDLIKGKGNASSVGTLVERTSGDLMLVKRRDATAASAVEGFSAALNRMPLVVRKSMTYDQGREMAKNAEITQNTGVAIYFCDPYSPWQRGSNENINSLTRQLLNGVALSHCNRPAFNFFRLLLIKRLCCQCQYPVLHAVLYVLRQGTRQNFFGLSLQALPHLVLIESSLQTTLAPCAFLEQQAVQLGNIVAKIPDLVALEQLFFDADLP